MTDAIIDKLQNYYGIAIRSNPGDLKSMKSAIHAGLFHVASSKNNNRHDHCPEGADSWCLHNRDKANGVSNYKPGIGLPLHVVAKVKPIYQDLSSDALLEKCLHGKTQNANECLNGLIWQRAPKTSFVGTVHVELAMYDAIAHFNIGQKAFLNILEQLKMNPGLYTLKGCQQLNENRINNTIYKTQDKQKIKRKVIRGAKKKKTDKDTEKEGIIYEPGGF